MSSSAPAGQHAHRSRGSRAQRLTPSATTDISRRPGDVVLGDAAGVADPWIGEVASLGVTLEPGLARLGLHDHAAGVSAGQAPRRRCRSPTPSALRRHRVHQADDARIREAASARAALPPRPLRRGAGAQVKTAASRRTEHSAGASPRAAPLPVWTKRSSAVAVDRTAGLTQRRGAPAVDRPRRGNAGCRKGAVSALRRSSAAGLGEMPLTWVSGTRHRRPQLSPIAAETRVSQHGPDSLSR